MADKVKPQLKDGKVVNELRLALATCGAITLVVYESGVCHELERMIRESQSEGESTWKDIFEKYNLTPVIDVLTGASAGGINSVLLGSCLVSKQPFSPFRRIWIEGLDASAMRHPASVTPRALLFTEPIFDRATGQVRTNARAAQTYREKLKEKGNVEFELRNDRLDLRLCLTDFAGTTVQTLDALGHRLDTETKSHVVMFSDDDLADPDRVNDPCTAAKATSAFPGLFDPVEIDRRWFVDGGLWNNQPIDQALNAIRDRPAYGRTHRAVLFIEPNPSKYKLENAEPGPGPSLLENISIIPGIGIKGSILPALDGLLDTNRRLEFYDQLIGSKPKLMSRVGRILLKDARNEFKILTGIQQPRTLLNQVRIDHILLDNDPRRIQSHRSLCSQLQKLDNASGSNLEAEFHLRLLDCLNNLNELDLIKRAIRREINDYNRELKKGDLPEKRDSLETVFDEKQKLYDRLAAVSKDLEMKLGGVASNNEPHYFARQFDRFVSGLTDWIQARSGTVPRPLSFDALLADIAAENKTTEFPKISPSAQVSSDKIEIESEDAARYILAGISDLDAKHRINLIRISPNDVNNHHLIGEQIGDQETAAQVKLASDGLGHVQGLFEEHWRRNDYVWGRLDAAEILLRTVQKFGSEIGHPMPEKEFSKSLLEIQAEILKQEVQVVPGLRALPVGSFACDRLDNKKIAANCQLIGFGRETLPDANEPRFADKLQGMIEAAQRSLNGSPKVAVSALSGMNRAARVFGFVLGITRPIWPNPYRVGTRAIVATVYLSALLAAFLIGAFRDVSKTSRAIFSISNSQLPLAFLAVVALILTGAGLGFEFSLAIPLVGLIGYIIGGHAQLTSLSQLTITDWILIGVTVTYCGSKYILSRRKTRQALHVRRAEKSVQKEIRAQTKLLKLLERSGDLSHNSPGSPLNAKTNVVMPEKHDDEKQKLSG